MRKYQAHNLIIEPGFCVGVAIILLSLPIEWSLSWLLSVAFHELSHIVALKILKKKIHSIEIEFSGAKINTEALEPFEEFVSSFAGPLGGLLLTILIRACPQLSICALIHSIFNLLPIHPMDGGRMLYGLITVISDDQKAQMLCNQIERITYIFILLALTILLTICKNYLLFAIIFFVILIRIPINLLAKKNNR